MIRGLLAHDTLPFCIVWDSERRTKEEKVGMKRNPVGSSDVAARQGCHSTRILPALELHPKQTRDARTEKVENAEVGDW